MWIVQSRRANRGGHLGRERIINVYDNERFVRKDISIRSDSDDASRAGQHASGIERERTLQEVIRRIAVQQSSNARTFGFQIWIANDNQAFFLVRYVEKPVEQVNGLLLVLWQLHPQRIDSQGTRGSHRLRILCRNVKAL